MSSRAGNRFEKGRLLFVCSCLLRPPLSRAGHAAERFVEAFDVKFSCPNEAVSLAVMSFYWCPNRDAK